MDDDPFNSNLICSINLIPPLNLVLFLITYIKVFVLKLKFIIYSHYFAFLPTFALPVSVYILFLSFYFLSIPPLFRIQSLQNNFINEIRAYEEVDNICVNLLHIYVTARFYNKMKNELKTINFCENLEMS